MTNDKSNGMRPRSKTARIPFVICNSSFVIAAALLLAGCNVKDPIYEASLTEHPEHGKITLTTDWANRGAGIDIPAEYTVTMGDYSEDFTGATNTPDELFDPDEYNLYVYNQPGNPAVNATTATADYPAGMLGWLFTSAQSVTIEADKVHELTAVMQQQVRELTLIIAPTGSTTDKVASITATLSGVAGTLDFANGTHGAPTGVALVFTKQTSGDYAGKWTATVRLLGVTGIEQKLTGTITFTGGNPAVMPLESDLSTDLATFNDEKNRPLTLDGEAVDLPEQPGFTATINGWTKVTGSGTAN